MPNDVAHRPVADDELFIERSFDAPARLLFDMWSKPEHFLKWFGPHNSQCLEANLDFRVGGAWGARILMPTYGERRMGGRYLEIEPGRRIVMTFRWLNGEPDPETVVTITFAEAGGRAVQTFHQTPFETVARRDSHIEGWTSVFNCEQAYAEAPAKETVQ